jgi:hypothetical protein
MSKKPLNISEEAAVQMPMKTVASLIIIVALGTMGYFQIIERLNVADTRIQIMEKDLEENTEFRIKWPRGIEKLKDANREIGYKNGSYND